MGSQQQGNWVTGAKTEAPITGRILFLNASLVFWGFKVPWRLAEKIRTRKGICCGSSLKNPPCCCCCFRFLITEIRFFYICQTSRKWKTNNFSKSKKRGAPKPLSLQKKHIFFPRPCARSFITHDKKRGETAGGDSLLWSVSQHGGKKRWRKKREIVGESKCRRHEFDSLLQPWPLCSFFFVRIIWSESIPLFHYFRVFYIFAGSICQSNIFSQIHFYWMPRKQ